MEGKNKQVFWTAYGKVSKVIKATNDSILYRYDATGQRISKTFKDKTTFYVRDASGNVMATYEQTTTTTTVKEINIYGNSRVGSYNGKSARNKEVLGNKNYELSNHLGNVLVTITDNKFIETTGVFIAKVNSTTDYYPFGMAITERTWQSKEYRYGFNTQEKDFDIDESGNHTTAEFWEYDSRSGRRWNVDPMPMDCISNYATNLNCPVRFSDILGNTPNGGGGGGGGTGVGSGQGTAPQPGQASSQPLPPPTGRGGGTTVPIGNQTTSYPVIVSDQMGFQQIVDGIGTIVNGFRDRNATVIRPTVPLPKTIQQGFLGSLTQEQVDEYEELQRERAGLMSESATRAFDNNSSKGGRLNELRGAIFSGTGLATRVWQARDSDAGSLFETEIANHIERNMPHKIIYVGEILFNPATRKKHTEVDINYNNSVWIEVKTGVVENKKVQRQLDEAEGCKMTYVLYHENLPGARRKQLVKDFGDKIIIITNKADLLKYLKTK